MEYWNQTVMYGGTYESKSVTNSEQCYNFCLRDEKCLAIHYTESEKGYKKCHLKESANNWNEINRSPVSILALKCEVLPGNVRKLQFFVLKVLVESRFSQYPIFYQNFKSFVEY